MKLEGQALQIRVKGKENQRLLFQGKNKNSTGYGSSGSTEPPRCLPIEPFREHCKDTS